MREREEGSVGLCPASRLLGRTNPPGFRHPEVLVLAG